MPDSKTKAEDIPFMMLESGKITSNVDFWVGGVRADGYREVAKCPPIKVTSLTENLTESILASPDLNDIYALKDLVLELKASLEIVDKTITKLNKA